MKIGLIRHFKVKHPFPRKNLLTKSELIKWFEDYDKADVEHNAINLYGVDWKHCYTSPLERAMHTANQAHNGKIIPVDVLRELDILHLLPEKIKLPFLIWGILVRMKSFSSNEYTHQFKSRISIFLNELLLKNEGNVIIVSHWFVMKVLQKELVKRGLKSKDFNSSSYGVLYIFEKPC